MVSEQSPETGRGGLFGSVIGKLQALLGGASQEVEPAADESKPCCEGIVHVAYRGVSDDHLYMAYKRKWTEVKFFKQRNLRVFCAGCRRRLL